VADLETASDRKASVNRPVNDRVAQQMMLPRDLTRRASNSCWPRSADGGSPRGPTRAPRRRGRARSAPSVCDHRGRNSWTYGIAVASRIRLDPNGKSASADVALFRGAGDAATCAAASTHVDRVIADYPPNRDL